MSLPDICNPVNKVFINESMRFHESNTWFTFIRDSKAVFTFLSNQSEALYFARDSYTCLPGYNIWPHWRCIQLLIMSKQSKQTELSRFFSQTPSASRGDSRSHDIDTAPEPSPTTIEPPPTSIGFRKWGN